MTLDPELALLAETVDTFVERQVRPSYDDWEAAGIIDRSLFVEAGKQGLLGFGVPEEYGGPGDQDFRANAVVIDRLARALVPSLVGAVMVHNDVVLPYLLRLATEEQKQRWLPGTVTGETLLAIAMTEPGTGSDLAGIQTSARRDGDDWVINGSKTFISNGQHADLVVAATRTSEDPHGGLTLFVVERGTAGFTRGRNLQKVGMKAQDTSELSFADCRVPDANRLGTVGGGFGALMSNLPQERLSLAISALAAAEAVFDLTLDYAKSRTAFGKPVGSFQHNKFVLAEMRTELDVARAYLDDRLDRHVAGTLTATDAAAAKWWCTDMQVRLVDRCVQMHGGYGYMLEYPVARAFTDARAQTIYGGTTEIMKEIVGRSLGL
jgi:long-chain-acyl-CoA dehydrogenase